MNKIIRILKYQNFNKLRLLCLPILHRSPRNDCHCERKRSNLIVLLIIFFVLHFTPFTLYAMEPAQILWEDASNEIEVGRATDKLREIVEKYPESPFAVDAQYTIAEHKYLEGDYAQAYKEFQTLIEKFPRNKYASLAWHRRASCLFIENKYDEAIKEFKQSIYLDPWSENSNLAKVGIADAYFVKGDYNRALREYRQISSNQPFQNYILYKITLCYQSLHNKKGFMMSKEELIKKYPLSLESALIARVTELDTLAKQVPASAWESGRVIEPVNLPAQAFWTIQVGSFTKEENARNLSAVLIKKGYISWIQPVKIGNGFFYRVYLGKFNTEEEVKKKVEEVSLKENLPTRILSVTHTELSQ